MSAPQTDGIPLRSYLRVISRWKWLVIAVTALAVGLAGAYTWTRTPLYQASAELLYERPIDLGNPLGQGYTDPNERQAELESVPSVIAGSDIGTTVAKEVDLAFLARPYTVAVQLQPNADGSSYTNVVFLSATAPSPVAAAAIANGYAAAFIEWRRQSAQQQVQQAIEVINTKLESFTTPQSRVTTDYIDLKQKLQALELLKATATGNFKVIAQASPPLQPASPRKTRNLALGGALGLFFGLVVAFVVQQFDTKVRDEEQVVAALELPVLGHIPPVRRRNGDTNVLLTLSDPGGRSAEAFRLLRSNLEFMGIDAEIKSLLVSSSVQREGKSVTACNLAVAMALAGKRVIIVDGDLRSPRVHAYMGLSNPVGVSSVVARKVGLREALVPVLLSPAAHTTPLRGGGFIPGTMAKRAATEAGGSARPLLQVAAQRTAKAPASGRLWSDDHEETPTLYVLPSGPLPPNPGEIIASRRFGTIIDELAAAADLVLVDAPAMLAVGDTAAIAPRVDALIYVVDATMVRRPLLTQVRGQLEQLPCRKLGLVLIESKVSHGYYGYRGYYHENDSGDGSGPKRGQT